MKTVERTDGASFPQTATRGPLARLKAPLRVGVGSGALLAMAGPLLSGLLVTTLWFASENLEANRRTFLAMESDSRKELVRKWERFLSLPAAEKQRLQDFHARLESQPNADRLREIMNHYFDWNSALSDRDRAALSTETLSVATADQRRERIERLQKILLAQYEQNLGRDEATRLSFADLTQFVEWSNQRIEQRRNATREERERLNLWPPSEEELNELQARFSSKAAALMQQAKDRPSEGRDGRPIDGRVNLVINWLQAIFQPSRAMLKSVYDSLDEEERMALSDLPEMTPEAIERKLLDYYSQRARIPYGIPGLGGRPRGFGGGAPGAGRGSSPSPSRGSDNRRENRD
jgi:hypothetical protein